MAININIPSQVKTYANLAAFPATGSLKTIFIAEDTNKTYRWTGSAYVEISASQATAWGAITGTLSNQTDLQTALNAKQDSLGFTAVPTTRTLTINGTTQDLSADRTFTISTGITIGSTAITSGTIGRVLFEGAGNVVQESANMTYDNTNLIFTLGSTATRILTFRPQDTTGAYGNSCSIRGGISNGRIDFYSASNITEVRDNIILLTSATGPSIQVGTGSINLNVGGTRLQVAPTTGNILIGTTTDAGFKLDVNGTARFTGQTTYANNMNFGGNSDVISPSSNSGNFDFLSNLPIRFLLKSGSVERMRIVSSTGNILINTTTDVASSKLTIESTTQGFLPPRMTTTQKNAIATPATGLMVYDTTLNLMSVYNGTTWITL